MRLAIVLSLVLIPALADAQKAPDPAPQTGNMTLVLHDPSGHPKPDFTSRDQAGAAADPACSKCAPLTIGSLLAQCLNAPFESERNLDFGQRFARAKLADRIKDATSVAFSRPEQEVIEKVLAEAQVTGDLIAQIMPQVDPGYTPPPLR